MKKLYVLLFAACLLGVGMGYASHVKHVKKILANQSTSQLLTKESPVYTLTLPSNPSTGFSWFIVSYDHDLLTLASHNFIKPKTGLVGASGQEVWQFEAKDVAFSAPHVMTIKLIYARPWMLVKGTKSIASYKAKVITLVTR